VTCDRICICICMSITYLGRDSPTYIGLRPQQQTNLVGSSRENLVFCYLHLSLLQQGIPKSKQFRPIPTGGGKCVTTMGEEELRSTQEWGCIAKNIPQKHTSHPQPSPLCNRKTFKNFTIILKKDEEDEEE